MRPELHLFGPSLLLLCSLPCMAQLKQLRVPVGSVTLAQAAYRSLSSQKSWIPVAATANRRDPASRVALEEVVQFGLERQRVLDRGLTLRMMRVDAAKNLLDTANAAISLTKWGVLSTPLVGLTKDALKYDMMLKNRAREAQFLDSLAAALKRRLNSSESLKEALATYQNNPAAGAGPLTKEAHAAYLKEVEGLAAVSGLSPKAKNLLDAETFTIIAGLIAEGRLTRERITSTVAGNKKKLKAITNELAVAAEFRARAEGRFKSLEVKIQAWSDKLDKLRRLTAAEFSKMRSEIAGIGKEVVKVADQARDNRGRIEVLELQQKLQQVFNRTISKEVLENTGRINYNQDLLYSILTPDQRIAALSDPRFMPHRSATWKRKEIEEQTAIKERQELAKDIQAIQAIANGAYQIAADLGLEGKDAERAAEALSWVNAAAGVGMAYAAPSPQTIMNALVGVSALFGGGQSEDPKFKAIMEQFNELHKSLSIISKQIETVQKNQILIMERLIAVERSVHARFDDICRQLGDVYQLQKDHVALSMAEVVVDVDPFRRFLVQREKFVHARGVSSEDQWERRARHYASLGDLQRQRMWGAVAELEGLLTKRPFHPFWRLALWVQRDPRAEDYSAFESRAYTPLIKKCLAVWGDRPSTELVEALAIDDGQIPQMRSTFLLGEKLEGRFSEDADIRDLLGRLLNAEAIVTYAIEVLEARHYLAATLEDKEDHFMTPSEFLTDSANIALDDKRFSRRQRVYRMLESCVQLIDVSIAQQQLLSGSYSLLPLEWTFRAFLKGKVDKEAEETLLWNSILAHNLTAAMIRWGVDGLSWRSYEKAWVEGADDGGAKTMEALRRAVPGPWKAALAIGRNRAREVVGVRLSHRLWVALPSPAEVAGPVARPRFLSDLRNARALVLSAMDEFHVMKDSGEFESSPESRQSALSRLIFN